MILADSSVWIEHLRRGSPAFARQLDAANVVIHPFVIGEIACGNLRNRRLILADLAELPRAPVATDDEAMAFIENRRLMGKGVGYVDVHLLASVALARDVTLWTFDVRLASLAGR